MPPQVNLVRPDGSMLAATPEQADRLKLLGYQEEDPNERTDRVVEEGRQNYYTTGGQQAKTAGEGLLAGLTSGSSDWILGDDNTRARAQYNPGTRMGSEALGALLPLVMSGGTAGVGLLGEEAAGVGAAAGAAGEATQGGGLLSNLARYTPSYAIGEIGEMGAGAAFGEGANLAKSVTSGVLQGAYFGTTNAMDHAWLNSDHLTAEAVFHGMGWGAVFGGGLGALGAGFSKLGEKAQQAELVAQKEAKAVDAYKVGEEAWGNVVSETKALKDTLKVSLKQADDTIKTALGKFEGLESETVPEKWLAASKLSKAYKRASAAAEAGDATAVASHIEKYGQEVDSVAQHTGITAQVGNATQGLEEITSLKALNRELKSVPKTTKGFVSMSGDQSEKLFASLEKASQLKDFPQVADAIKTSMENFTKTMGMEPNGLQGFREAWGTLRAAKPSMDKLAAEGGTSLARKALGYGVGGKAYMAAKAAGAGPFLAISAARMAKNAVTGRKLAGSLVETRNAVVGRIRAAAAKYLPKVARGTAYIAPRIEPLSIKLDGTKDTSTKVRSELAAARIKEFYQAAPAVKGTLYRAIEPLMLTQPQLAPAMHEAGVTAFRGMHEFLPKDPGAMSGLKSLWNPDPAQTEVVSRRMAVFHDPVGEAEMMMTTGHFDPIKVETLKNTAPAIYQELRISMLERVTDPKIMEQTSYQDQVGLSAMLGIAIHSSMEPKFIASAQQIFTDRNKPNSTPNQLGASSGGGGKSAKDNPLATAVQINDQH